MKTRTKPEAASLRDLSYEQLCKAASEAFSRMPHPKLRKIERSS